MSDKLKILLKNPYTALLSSSLAVVLALIGLYFSYTAYRLSIEEYRQERLLILRGKVVESGQTLSVESVTDSSYFLSGEMFLPPSIYKNKVPISSSGEVWHLGSVFFELENWSLNQVKPKTGHVQVTDGSLPVLIKSFYAAKGISYTDVALYMLDLTAVLNEGEHSRPKIKITGLTFVERMEEGPIWKPKMLDEMIAKGDMVNFPSRSPSFK